MITVFYVGVFNGNSEESHKKYQAEIVEAPFLNENIPKMPMESVAEKS
jgi:hypothetical protein